MLSARTLIKASCVIGTEIYMVHTKLKDQIIYKLPNCIWKKTNWIAEKKHLRVISLLIDFLISVVKAVKGYNWLKIDKKSLYNCLVHDLVLDNKYDLAGFQLKAITF